MQKEHVDITMLEYINKNLQKFLHKPPTRKQRTPHKYNKPVYEQKLQYTLPESTLPILEKAGTTRIQAIHAAFLYYSRVVVPYILPDINEISLQQAKPTQETNNKDTMLMDNAHTYPDAKVHYKASDIQL